MSIFKKKKEIIVREKVYCDECKFFPENPKVRPVKCGAYTGPSSISRKHQDSPKMYCEINNSRNDCKYFKERE
ncbi:hypothetical protein KKH23_07880 [Patescibacteria group bacterium]|nr:hypothetical protein [Patescibacteria group bacterium]